MNYTKCFICGNEVEIDHNTVVCNNCGFHTMDLYEDLTDNYTKDPQTEFDYFLLGQPMLIKNLIKLDSETKLYWLPITYNCYPKFSIFPIGHKDNWNWGMCNYIPIPVFERINYPIEGKSNEYYEYSLDLKNIKSFNSFNEIYEIINK